MNWIQTPDEPWYTFFDDAGKALGWIQEDDQPGKRAAYEGLIPSKVERMGGGSQSVGIFPDLQSAKTAVETAVRAAKG